MGLFDVPPALRKGVEYVRPVRRVQAWKVRHAAFVLLANVEVTPRDEWNGPCVEVTPRDEWNGPCVEVTPEDDPVQYALLDRVLDNLLVLALLLTLLGVPAWMHGVFD